MVGNWACFGTGEWKSGGVEEHRRNLRIASCRDQHVLKKYVCTHVNARLLRGSAYRRGHGVGDQLLGHRTGTARVSVTSSVLVVVYYGRGIHGRRSHGRRIHGRRIYHDGIAVGRVRGDRVATTARLGGVTSTAIRAGSRTVGREDGLRTGPSTPALFISRRQIQQGDW